MRRAAAALARFSMHIQTPAPWCSLAVVALLLLGCHSALADWQITRFEIYEGKPVYQPNWEEDAGSSVYDSIGDALDLPRGWRLEEQGNEIQRADSELLREIEKYLGQVAEEYSKMGFADPVAEGWLDSIVRDANGNKAIRVYLYDLPDMTRGFYSGGYLCSDPVTVRKIINFNARNFAPAGRIRDIDYVTLAHELFHAVQYASNFQQDSCGRDLWISEGTSDAIGHDMARALRGVTFKAWLAPRSTETIKIYGGRDYVYSLNDFRLLSNEQARKDAGYMTSSFWRYLAEIKYARVQNPASPLPGSLPVEGVDYSYLANIFSEPWNYGSTPKDSARWVNRVLKKEKNMKLSLARAYSTFISAFADYGQVRIAPERKRLGISRFGDPGPTTAQWLDQIFVDCERAAAFPATVSIHLQPNAAGCIEITSPAGPNLKTPAAVIQVIHNDEALLKQLRIGLLDGTLVSAPTIHSFMDDQPPFIARWTFPLYGDKEDIYIVSNISLQPHRTRQFTPELYFALAEWSDDLWQGPLPAKRPPAPDPPPPKRDREKDRLKKVIADPVNHLMPIPKVERKQWRRPCQITELKYNLCSAKMVITVNYAAWNPRINPLSDQLVITDVFKETLAFSPSGVSVPNAQFEAGLKTERFLESVDASKIRIEIPKTEYGFTGTYNNASIKVSKAGGTSYLSYGPTIVEGDRRIHRPPNGSVTIEEYSHLVLRGSFSASLVDLDDPGRDESPMVARTINGSFTIPSPYQLDEDFSIVEDHFKQEMIQNMMQSAPFGAGVMDGIIQSTGGAPPQILCDEGVDEEFLEAMGFTSGCEGRSGGGELAQQCTCECDSREAEEELPRCQQTCRKEWRGCPLPEDVASGSLDEQLEHCKKSMLKKGVPEGQIPLFLEQIRITPETMRKDVLKALC